MMCTHACVCALDPLITSSLGLCHPKDYFSTLCVIFKYYLKNQINFARRTVYLLDSFWIIFLYIKEWTYLKLDFEFDSLKSNNVSNAKFM